LTITWPLPIFPLPVRGLRENPSGSGVKLSMLEHTGTDPDHGRNLGRFMSAHVRYFGAFDSLDFRIDPFTPSPGGLVFVAAR